MNFKEMLEKISVLSEETQETKKGRVHKAEPGGYGRKFDTDEEGDEKKEKKPEVKRGRGRPKKGSDESGEVKKYEFGGVEKAMGGGKAPKKTPKPSTKHTLKDWFEMMDKKAIKEATAPGQQLSVKPLPGASQLVDPASNKVIATGPADKIKAMQGSVAKGEVTMTGHEDMTEEDKGNESRFGNLSRDDIRELAGRAGMQELDPWTIKLAELVVRYCTKHDTTVLTPEVRNELGRRAGYIDGMDIWDHKFAKLVAKACKEGVHDPLGLDESEDKKWIKGAIKQPGAFTKKAKSHGMTTSAFASKVLANKEKYPAKTEKQAVLAKTLGKLKEADIPSDQVDMGAGLGAGRSQKTLETKKLDELSPQTLRSYAGKARGQGKWAAGVAHGLSKGGEYKNSESDKYAKFAKKRFAGADKADSKLGGKSETEPEYYDWSRKGGYGTGNTPVKGAALESKSKPDFLDLDKDKNKKEPMKKAAKDMKKDKVNESMHKHNAAKLLGKAHALAKEGYNCKFEDMEEARMYHEGFKEGLDECYGLMPARGVVDETSMPATTPGMASAAMPAMEAMSQDNLFDAIQPVIDFAMSKGYTVKKGRGNSVDFMYDLGMGPDEVVMNARVYFDKDFNEPWVNFQGMGVSGTDPAKHFLGTFKENHKAVMDEVSAEKDFRKEVGDNYEFMEEGMSTDGLFDSIQPVLNFAMSKGYTVKKGKGNSINFMYDLGMGDEVVMNATVYFDKDLNEPWVNFEGMDMSGNDPAKQFLGTFKQNHAAVMDEVGAEKQSRDDDLAFREGNAFTGALAKTPKGEKFSVGGKTFTDTSTLEEYQAAFESLDKQLNQLLTEGEQVDEGMSVSISKGQQGSPDSVTVSAQDAEAEQLLGFIKQAGLGLFGDSGPAANYGAPDGDSSVDHGGIKVVGDHDGMMGLMKKLSGLESEPQADYEEEGGEEGHEEEHLHGEEGPEMCSECGGMMEEGHQCSKEPVEEVETDDQRLAQVAEDNPPDSDEAETTADEKAEAEEDLTKPAFGGATNESVEGLNEWANDAGQTSEEFKEETFTTDMEFMLKTISGGLNKPKSTGQQTIPVLAGDEERTNIEESNAWYTKYSNILKQAE